MDSNKEFEGCRSDFKRLIQEGALPPKMELKLLYLEGVITGQQLQLRLMEGLPQFQRLSLQMTNRQTKISLFNSIVNCLSGRQLITYFQAERSYFKKDSGSSHSISCYLFGNSNQLTVSRNKEQTDVWHSFPIEKLLVSKLYHKEKKKYFFNIALENIKYKLKFDQEGTCARIHGSLLTAIREKKSLKSRSNPKASFGQSRMRQELQAQLWDETGEERIFDEQKEYLVSLSQKIQEVNIHINEGFQLVRNIAGGKVLSSADSQAVKVLMFLERCSIADLIESYVQFGAWNVQVDTFRVEKKIRNNTFMAYLKLKKKNLFSSAREGYFTLTYFKDCPCLILDKQNRPNKPVKHYLLIKKVKQQSSSGGVEMQFNQIVEFSQVEGQPGVVFLNLLSQIDFNVYQYLQSSMDMNLQFVEEVGSINVLCHERQMLTSKTTLFEVGVCVCDRKKSKDNFLSPHQSSRRKGSAMSEVSEDFSNRIEEEQKVQISQKEIISIIREYNNLSKTDKILDVIRDRLYEKYYLKGPFSHKPNDEAYVSSDYHLRERVNFLSLGNRWKLTKSEDYVFIDEEELTLQKGILKLIVKQITTNLMAGKSIMSMTLPVQIFDDYSTVESFSWIFGFVPVFMAKALKEEAVEEQIKYIALAFLYMLACNPKVSKPFNPILGETCEVWIGGIPLYMEQISHHPPISAFLMKTDEFEISGMFDVLVDIGLNSANTKIPCPIKVKLYAQHRQYIIRQPEIQLSGIMFGDRGLALVKTAYVLEKNSGTYLQYSIGKDKKKLYESKQKLKKADLAGGVFKITKQAVERLLSITDKKKTVEGIKQDEAIERFSLLSGKWYGDLYFDNVCYKSLREGPFPVQPERPGVLLPSDCAFRLDVVYRRWRNFKKSNEEKQVLQNLQRRDRKLREKHHPQK